MALSHIAEISMQVDDRPVQLTYVIAFISGCFSLRAQTYYAAALAHWWAWGVCFHESIPALPVFLVGLVLATAAAWYGVDRLCARTLARTRLARDVAEIMERDR